MNRVKLNRLDLFPKFDRQFEQDAREVNYFFSVVENHEMLIDSDVGGDMTISLDLTVHRVPCDILTVTTVDAFGGMSVQTTSKLVKEPVKRTDADRLDITTANLTTAIPSSLRNKCPSCYGAAPAGTCCPSCHDVRVAYEKKGWKFDVFSTTFSQCHDERSKVEHLEFLREGCRIHGSFDVPRVTGSLHILPGRFFFAGGQHMFDPLSSFTSHLNLSHTFSVLQFGEYFPGQLNPLGGTAQIRGETKSNGKKQANGRFSYFLQVIPTRFESRSLVLGMSSVLESNQYSATQHFVPCKAPLEHPEGKQPEQKLHPGIFISYDLAPIKVHIRRQHPYPSVPHLLLQLCAVCGGVLTVAGIIDSMLFHGMRKISQTRKLI